MYNLSKNFFPHIPGGTVVGDRVLLAATVIVLGLLEWRWEVIFFSNGKWPPLCVLANFPFTPPPPNSPFSTCLISSINHLAVFIIISISFNHVTVSIFTLWVASLFISSKFPIIYCNQLLCAHQKYFNSNFNQLAKSVFWAPSGQSTDIVICFTHYLWLTTTAL